MDKLPVLDPRLMNHNELGTVNRLFDALCEDPTDADRHRVLDEAVGKLVAKYDGQIFEKEAQASLFSMTD